MPKSIAETPEPRDSPQTYGIEHVPVENDPRKWTPFRKVCRLLVHIKSDTNDAPYFQNFTLALISSAAMIVGLAGNIQNRDY